MKIALCFAGQARSFKKGYEYYKRNLLDNYDVDVYIHTWQFDLQQELANLYNPVAHIFEEPPETNANTKYTHTPDAIKYPPRNNWLQFYSLNKVKELIDEKINYDWIIRTRLDFALNLVIPFTELDANKLYIPNCRMVPERDFGNDQFAFSSKENMFKYMSTFNNLDKYYNKGAQFVGEELMKANLHEHGLIGEKLVYFNPNHPFPPGPYNGTWHSLIRDDMQQWKK
jgi:hypothetical protein